MSTSVTSLDQIDLEISLAQVALSSARSVLTRCPTGDNTRRVEEAQAEVDRLLDLRFVVQG
jgi:hypothetical protein